MKKLDFVRTIARENNLTNQQANDIITSVLNHIVEDVSNEGEFRYPGFGSFAIKTRGARDIISPTNGREYHVPERKSIAFRAAKAFKEAVNAAN